MMMRKCTVWLPASKVGGRYARPEDAWDGVYSIPVQGGRVEEMSRRRNGQKETIDFKESQGFNKTSRSQVFLASCKLALYDVQFSSS